MFDFRIIETPDGNQVIRHDLKTPYNALTPLQFLEYTEVDVQLASADMQKKKMLRIKREKEQQLKIVRNPLYRLACFCGMI